MAEEAEEEGRRGDDLLGCHRALEACRPDQEEGEQLVNSERRRLREGRLVRCLNPGGKEDAEEEEDATLLTYLRSFAHGLPKRDIYTF